MLSEDLKKHRAEYTDVKDCFEGNNAYSVLFPLFTNKDTKLIIGDKGTGKTHLLQLLYKEKPIEMYSLDKEKLQCGIISYNRQVSGPNPLLTVVEDLHYALKYMKMSGLKNGYVNEEEFLDNLSQFKEHAKEIGSTLVFVADEGPAGLSMRFNKNENKIRLLNLLDGCVSSADDIQIFRTYLNKSNYHERDNILDLNCRGIISPNYSGADIEVLKKLFFDVIVDETDWRLQIIRTKSRLINNNNMQDIDNILEHLKALEIFGELKNCPLDSIKRRAENVWRPSYALDSAGSIAEESRRKASKNIIKTFKIRDIPLAYCSRYSDDHEVLYVFNKRGVLTSDMIIHKEMIEEREGKEIKKKWILARDTPNRPIATIRQLKALSENYGEISRKALYLNTRRQMGKRTEALGTEQTEIFKNLDKYNGLDLNQFSGYIYTKRELSELRNKLNERFLETVKHDDSILSKIFYDTKISDEEVASVMLAQQLALE